MSEFCTTSHTMVALETRLFVRAGMDPRYRDPAFRDRMARFYLELNRPWSVRAAVAVLAGWASSYEKDVPGPPVAWHRAFGNTRVSVGGPS